MKEKNVRQKPHPLSGRCPRLPDRMHRSSPVVSLRNGSVSAGFSEPVKVRLYGGTHIDIPGFILFAVIAFLRPDVQHHANGEEIEIPYGNPDLRAPEEKQRRGYFPAALDRTFFLAGFTSVFRLLPHSSRISGRIS